MSGSLVLLRFFGGVADLMPSAFETRVIEQVGHYSLQSNLPRHRSVLSVFSISLRKENRSVAL